MNCATRLAMIFDAWVIPEGQTPWAARGGSREDDGLTTFREVADAIWLTTEVDRAVQGLKAIGEDVAHFEAVVPSWYAGALSFNYAWQQGFTLTFPIPSDSLAVLKSLGTVLNHLRSEAVLQQSDRDALVALFDEAVEIINDSSEIPQAERIRLLGLVEAARRTLGSLDIRGTDELRAQVAELALQLASDSQTVRDEPKRSRLLDIARGLWTRFDVAATAAGTAALTTGADSAVHAITQAAGIN